jgi:peroxiredoxin
MNPFRCPFRPAPRTFCCGLQSPLWSALGLAAVFLTAPLASASETLSASLGKEIERFLLKDIHGQQVSLADFKDKMVMVVVFIGTECPINNAYMPRLAELHKSYSPRGVQFLAVNANQQDTLERMAEHARTHAIPFPVLRDEASQLADRFEAERTPEAYILDAQRKIRYCGRIDDQFGIGYKRTKPARCDLACALDEVLSGRPVSQPTTTAYGCFISRFRSPEVRSQKLEFGKPLKPDLRPITASAMCGVTYCRADSARRRPWNDHRGICEDSWMMR